MVTLPPGAGIAAGGLAKTSSTSVSSVTEQLASWRKLDRNGMACAHCHAPDAFDLALFNFTDETIKRRAVFHVPEADADRIVQLVKHVRQTKSIRPRDPVEDRPFQPGGRVLPGATSAERDFEFGRTLLTKLPTLMGAPIDTVDKARAARDEILNWDLRRNQIGVPFPRWAEDGFHDANRGTMNDWLPEVPTLPPAEKMAALFALHDTYIADPSPRNLWLIQAFNEQHGRTPSLEGFTPTGVAAEFFGTKHSAMLFAQHLLRMEQEGVPIASAIGQPVILSADYRPFHPFFKVGDFGNNTAPDMNLMPPTEVARLTGGRNTTDGFRRMFNREILQQWWVLGWTFQGGQQAIANWHEYFPQSLVGHRGAAQPYMLHRVFATTTMQLHRSLSGRTTRNGISRESDLLSFWDSGELPGFTYTQNGTVVFHNADHRAMFETLSRNVVRMQLMLLKDAADARCAAAQPYATATNIARFQDNAERWIAGGATVAPSAVALDRALVATAYAAEERLRRGCGSEPAAGGGSGLTVQVFNDTAFTTEVARFVTGGDRVRAVPPAQATATNVSMRFSGRIEPRFSDSYRFSIDGPDNNDTRIWVNGQLVTEPGRRVAVALPAGQAVEVRAEFTRISGRKDWFNALVWESAKELPRAVQSTQAYPAP